MRVRFLRGSGAKFRAGCTTNKGGVVAVADEAGHSLDGWVGRADEGVDQLATGGVVGVVSAVVVDAVQVEQEVEPALSVYIFKVCKHLNDGRGAWIERHVDGGRGAIAWRKRAVDRHEIISRQSDLLEIVGAPGATGCFAGRLDSRQ